MDKKLKDFLMVAKLLNDFGIKPVLYGSLGLYQIIEPLDPVDDIDLLIPDVWLKEKWQEFKSYLEEHQFKMDDEHEHEFSHPNIEGWVAFGSLEEAHTHSGLKEEALTLISDKNVDYFVLTPRQYLAAYQASLSDNYRQERKSGSDQAKIKAIQDYLANMD